MKGKKMEDKMRDKLLMVLCLGMILLGLSVGVQANDTFNNETSEEETSVPFNSIDEERSEGDEATDWSDSSSSEE